MNNPSSDIHEHAENAEALNDIADVLGMPTGSTTAEIVKKVRENMAAGDDPALEPQGN